MNIQLAKACAALVVRALRALRASVWLVPLLRTGMVFAGLLVLARIGQAAITIPVTALANGTNATTASVAEPMMALATPDAGTSAIDASAPPSPPPPTVSIASLPVAVHDTEGPIALNDATSIDLERLPGIGPKKAEAILALRTKLGRFHAIEDLLRVKGIGRKRLAKIRPLVTLERS